MKTKDPILNPQKLHYLYLGIIFVLSIFILVLLRSAGPKAWKKDYVQKFAAQVELNHQYDSQTVTLPAPKTTGGEGVYQSIQSRRSVREFADKSLNLAQVSQLLWSAQGITNKETGARSAPSAKSSYPVEMYLVAINVNGLDQAVYHYSPKDHTLKKLKVSLDKNVFYKGANEQASIKAAPAVFVMTAVMGRTQAKFPDSPASTIMREVYQETGHVAQNMYLTAEDLNLGMVVVGGYDPKALPQALSLSKNEDVAYLIPVGYKK